MRMIRFDVIDNQTGKYPDCETIALTEEWAKHLIYCDIDCFAITEDGGLILFDDCNNIAYPPSDRFTVTIDPESLRPKGEWIMEIIDKEKREISVSCSECEAFFSLNSFDFGLCYNFCPNCGADMRGEDDGND